MSIYKLTVFEPSGEKVMDESIEAANDDIAKEMGSKLLKEKGYDVKATAKWYENFYLETYSKI